jgi:hypothetical protein
VLAPALRRFVQAKSGAIIGFIAEHGHPVILAIVLVLIVTAAGIFYFGKGERARSALVNLVIASL